MSLPFRVHTFYSFFQVYVVENKHSDSNNITSLSSAHELIEANKWYNFVFVSFSQIVLSFKILSLVLLAELKHAIQSKQNLALNTCFNSNLSKLIIRIKKVTCILE